MIYDDNGVLMSVEEDTEIEVWAIKEGWHVLSWREVLEDKRKYFQEEFCVVRHYNAQLKKYRCCYLNFEGVNHFKKDFWRWCSLFADGFAEVLDYEGGVWYYIDYLGNVFDGKEVQEYWEKYGGVGSDELEQHLEEKLRLAQKKGESMTHDEVEATVFDVEVWNELVETYDKVCGTGESVYIAFADDDGEICTGAVISIDVEDMYVDVYITYENGTPETIMVRAEYIKEVL